MCPSSTTNSESSADEDSDLLPHDGEALLRGPLRKATAVLTVAVFLTIVVGTGIIDGCYPLPAPKVIGKEKQALEKRRKSARFADGSLARLIEYDLRTRSRVRSVALPYYAALLYRYLREAETTAVLGGEGWIFLRDRIDVDPGDEERRVIMSRRILQAVARRLRQVGSELIVLPIPRKSVVYHEMLPRGEDPRPHLYGELLRELSDAGVRAVDILTPYRARRDEVVFRKIDSHWNSLGMTIAAEALAEEMASRVPIDRRADEVKSLGLRRDPGDLLRLIGITRGSRAAALIDWPEYPRLRLFDRKGKLLPPRTNPSLPVAAAASGTSFTYNSFFPDFVRNATGQRIWFGAWPAIGPVEPFRRTLHNFRGRPLPKTLIWEIPAHNFFLPQAPPERCGPTFFRDLRRSMDDTFLSRHRGPFVEEFRLEAGRPCCSEEDSSSPRRPRCHRFSGRRRTLGPIEGTCHRRRRRRHDRHDSLSPLLAMAPGFVGTRTPNHRARTYFRLRPCHSRGHQDGCRNRRHPTRFHDRRDPNPWHTDRNRSHRDRSRRLSAIRSLCPASHRIPG